MPSLVLKPSHTSVRTYYQALEQFGKLGFDNEGNIRGAFEDLLKKCASQFRWTVVPEYQMSGKDNRRISVDACLIDEFHLPRGYWEAKDAKDDLDTEIQKKFAAGYPRSNILFQEPARAVLVQNGIIANPRRQDQDITQPDVLVRVLERFHDWQESPQQEWDRAVQRFSTEIPRLAQGVIDLIEREKASNRLFRERFTGFAELCRESINPDLRDDAVEEMLVQHLLTERIFRRIFSNSEFTRRNVIAAEIEEVIDSLTSRHFSRDNFLEDLDPFYAAIEKAADTTTTYAEKQHFLNHVYERFFQGFSKKQADTHGIVYTPQPIVDFMVKSVEDVLKTEFGRSLADQGVRILDPFTGTGNFITRIMQEIPASKLQKKYDSELHCNEVMLLPYYIASMNIEHAYLEKISEYKPFEGICLVDTFELAEQKQRQLSFMTEANTERIKKQKLETIFVVIGNPPYNSWQEEENDNAKNRKYPTLDQRMLKTYSKDSTAVNKNSLWDPYIRALRWASDRVGKEGIVAFVTKNSFAEGRVTEGVRKHLLQDFDALYILNLGGDTRDNPRLSGTTHNVFGIQVGVSINFFIRRSRGNTSHKVWRFETEEYWTKLQKFNLLERNTISTLPWQVAPSSAEDWIGSEKNPDFKALMCIDSVFELHSNGLKSNRDEWVYNQQPIQLEANIRKSIDFYNEQLNRWLHSDRKTPVDAFVEADDTRISWSSGLKLRLQSGKSLKFNRTSIVEALYRPFVRTYVYLDRGINERVYSILRIYPATHVAGEPSIVVTIDKQIDFSAMAVSRVPCVHLGGRPSRVFAYYIYNEDGGNGRENITDSALTQFRSHYNDPTITKWDIFRYTYAVLHHPEYRVRYAANLRRELPRLPYAPDFRRYSTIGKELMDLHINYEKQPEYPLERIESGKLNWRVEKMKLSKDKTALRYNGFLTLRGIPPEVAGYRLGNRSALDWIVDQYQVSTDKRSGIVNDPNREEDPEYIVRLIGQIIHVSLETVKRTRELASLVLEVAPLSGG